MATSEERTPINSDNVKMKRSIHNTIELPLLLSIIASSLTGVALNNILLYRTCLHHIHKTEEECKPFLSTKHSNETSLIEKEVQTYVSLVLTVKTVLEYIVPASLSLFLAAWSDTYGRKPLVTWPLLGMTISGILVVIFGMMENLGPWWFVATMIPFSFSGGYIVMFTAAYCYVSDTSTSETTSIRMMIVDASTTMGSIIGSLLTSYLVMTIGNVYLLLLAATINVIAYAFTNIVIVESLVGALRGSTSIAFDFALVKNIVRESIKERPNHGRAQILLISIVNILAVLVMLGTGMLDYLYTRQKLLWGMQEFTIFSAVSTAIAFVGGFLGLMVFQKLLRIEEISLSFLSLICGMVECLWKMLATASWNLYIGSVFGCLKGLLGPLSRSYIRKTVPIEDVAKIFALMSAVGSISPLISPIIFNSLYAATIGTFPGAIYLFSVIVTCINLVLLGIVKYLSWNSSPILYQELNTDPEL